LEFVPGPQFFVVVLVDAIGGEPDMRKMWRIDVPDPIEKCERLKTAARMREAKTGCVGEFSYRVAILQQTHTVPSD